jgi:photosystem II stability/assembly factor-like uncharacterized protein
VAQNIKISGENSPNETTIMFNPKDPATIVAAANLNNMYVSNDTGRTWRDQQMTSRYGVWGDPVLDVDSKGNFYYFHLSNPPDGSWIDRIVCQKSTDKGETWSTGTYTGLNGTKAQDKHWSAIDLRNDNIYLTWTQFDGYESKAPGDSTVVMFSRSEDGGETWSNAMRISKYAGNCLDGDSTVEGAVPTVGPNGEIYVSWAGPKGLVFNKSTDQGKTWLPQETVIDDMPTGWEYNVGGLGRCNGMPITDCDRSGGAHNGTIYVCWTDQRKGDNNTEVWLVKSTDGGDSWTKPARVNDDKGKAQQFLVWMTIDQATGYLYFIWYDRRGLSDNYTDVYLACSRDGGKTFINRKITESPFLPKNWTFFGDYTNIVAHNGIIRPIWTRSDKGKLSVWTDLTRPELFEEPVNSGQKRK